MHNPGGGAPSRILDLNTRESFFKADFLVQQFLVQTHSVTLIDGHKLVTFTGQGGLVLDEVVALCPVSAYWTD